MSSVSDQIDALDAEDFYRASQARKKWNEEAPQRKAADLKEYLQKVDKETDGLTHDELGNNIMGYVEAAWLAGRESAE